MIEKEYAIYAKIGDLKGFDLAVEREHITQYDIADDSNVRHRTRKTVKSGQTPVYTFTTKKKVAEGLMDAHQETTVTIDDVKFTQLQQHATLYTEKTRYVFNAENCRITINNSDIKLPSIKFEVDVYEDETGNVFEYCKIDIEINTLIDYIERTYRNIREIDLKLKISQLPFKPLDCKYSFEEEDKPFIDNFFKQVNLLED